MISVVQRALMIIPPSNDRLKHIEFVTSDVNFFLKNMPGLDVICSIRYDSSLIPALLTHPRVGNYTKITTKSNLADTLLYFIQPFRPRKEEQICDNLPQIATKEKLRKKELIQQLQYLAS